MEDISSSRGESIARYRAGDEFRSPNMKEKILIHLLDYVLVDRNSGAFPREITQKGMAEVINARRSHIAASLRGLMEQGLVDSRTSHVLNEERRQKVYFLTHKGYGRASDTLNHLLKMEICVSEKDSDDTVKSLAEIMSSEKKGIFYILNRIEGKTYITGKNRTEDVKNGKNHALPMESAEEDNSTVEDMISKDGEEQPREVTTEAEKDRKDEEGAEKRSNPDKTGNPAPRDIKTPLILVFGLILLSIPPVLYYISDYLMGVAPGWACTLIFLVPLLGTILAVVSITNLLKRKGGENAAFLSVSAILFILIVYLKIIISIMTSGAATPEPDLYLWMALIFLPAFMLVSLKTMDVRYRIKIASFIGTFIIMLGLFYSLFPHSATDIFSSSIADSSFLLVGGTALFFYSSFLSRPDSYREIRYMEIKDLQVSASISGLSLFLFIVLLYQLSKWELTSIQYTTAVLWLVLFLFILLVGVGDFFGIEISEFIFILKKGIFAEISAIFIIGGILLILNGLTAPGIIECLIGLPIAIKSVKDMKDEGIHLLWYSTAFIILLELLTVTALL